MEIPIIKHYKASDMNDYKRFERDSEELRANGFIHIDIKYYSSNDETWSAYLHHFPGTSVKVRNGKFNSKLSIIGIEDKIKCTHDVIEINMGINLHELS